MNEIFSVFPLTFPNFTLSILHLIFLKIVTKQKKLLNLIRYREKPQDFATLVAWCKQ